jgi:anti-anti-sigma factor
MRNSDTFSVELERLNGATHLRLGGRFDVAATPVLDEAIAVIRRRDVILDLEAVTFMDSAAWLAIMAYEHRVHDWGMKFRLVHVPANIRRIFEATATEYLFSEAAGARTDGRDQEVRSS